MMRSTPARTEPRTAQTMPLMTRTTAMSQSMSSMRKQLLFNGDLVAIPAIHHGQTSQVTESGSR